METRKIKVNKIRCKSCGDVIESEHTHDFRWCKCGSVAVDGGKSYLKRCGNIDNIEELSIELCAILDGKLDKISEILYNI